MNSPEILSALTHWRRVNDKVKLVEVQILTMTRHPNATDAQMLECHALYKKMMAEIDAMQEQLRKKWPRVTTKDGRRSIWDREFL
jgi:hypothetical protein